MDCPNCRLNSIDFNKIYLWPFGTKSCPECDVKFKAKNNWKLALTSMFLGGLGWGAPIAFDNYWYFVLFTYWLDCYFC